MNTSRFEASFDWLKNHPSLLVSQKFEWLESLGLETRNKYQFRLPDETPVAYAAEKSRGVLAHISRQIFGHLRSFEIEFFSTTGELLLNAHHPWCLLFPRLEVRTAEGHLLGAIQKRFSLLSKRLDVEDENGSVIFQAHAPMWKPWTFTLTHQSREFAIIQKRWSGFLSEMFTDRDNFLIQFHAEDLRPSERALILAAAVLIDLIFFETKN